MPLWCLLAFYLAACGGRQAALVESLPAAEAFPGWVHVGDAQVFERENLYSLVNGQAESFFAFGFEQVALGRYEGAGGAMLDVEVWQVATPADAYGLFRANASGVQATLGNGGDLVDGRRLIFWQDRYYVHVRALPRAPEADLRGFAQAVSEALPLGGEPPRLVSRLPVDGLVEDSILFFHQEISIQDQLWLGGENLLGLSPATAGVLARYDVAGTSARLLLIEYPERDAASAGLAALEGSDVADLVAAAVREATLGAVVGLVDQEAARSLLDAALAPE
jgi:hypothetical protein